MTDEQKQKRRDYQREYYKKYYAAKKLTMHNSGVIWKTLIRTQQTLFSPPILWGHLAHFELGSVATTAKTKIRTKCL